MSTPDPTSRVIAASAYTRGLWQPILLLLRLARPGFYGSSGHWGLDVGFIRQHALRAVVYAVGWFGVLALGLFVCLETHNQIIAFIGAWLVLIQWNIYPWVVTRSLLRGDADYSVPPTQQTADRILTPGSDFNIPDLGYLVREAQFGIDTTKTMHGMIQTDKATRVDAEEVLREMADAFRDSGQHLWARIVCVQSSRSIQRSMTAAEAIRKAAPGTGGSRLLVFGTSQDADGMNIAEVAAWNVGQHLSLLIRLRWLPPLRKSLEKLRYIANEKFWWRGFMLPVLLLGVAGLLVGVSVVLIETASESLDIPGAVAEAAEQARFRLGGAGLVFLIALVVSIGFPILYLAARLLERLFHYLQGRLYSLAGRYFAIRFFSSLRRVIATTSLTDEEALYHGVACVQVMEEVLRNAAVAALERRGIDASQLREQFNVFINEGIYVTGGTVRADQLAVGRRARAKGRARRPVRGGRSAVT